MGQKNNKRGILLPVVLAASLLLFLAAGGRYFSGYLREQIVQERTSQLMGITSQARLNLDNTLDAKWHDLNAAVNVLRRETLAGEGDLMRSIGELEGIFGMDARGSRLILIDSGGNCFGADGKYGGWPGVGPLVSGQAQDTFIYEKRYWVFARGLGTPLGTWEGGAAITHAVLFQDAQAVTGFFDSSAYSSQSESYLLKSDGAQMQGGCDPDKLLQSSNALSELEGMEGQSCPDIRAALVGGGMAGGRFYRDGEEYYYCAASLAQHDTLLLFLVPSGQVAAETVDMVGMMVRTMLLLTVVLLFLAVCTAAAVSRQQGSRRIIRQEQANLRRQEDLYADLEDSNAQLWESYTQLSEAKMEAERSSLRAEEASKAKSEFLFNMSHDIRTPMNAILGFLALMRDEADDPEAVLEYNKHIEAASQHLLGLINDVLDMSQIESGKVTLNLAEMNLADMVEEINAVIRPLARAKHQAFTISAEPLAWETLYGDKLRINQVQMSLLSNATKFTPEGGGFDLRIEELPSGTAGWSHIRFTVSDNGIGMGREYLKILFDPFTREQTSTDSGVEGTGLGMAIAKNLVELMGGAIRAESELGKGSIFTVDLELAIPERAAQGPDAAFWKGYKLSRMLLVGGGEGNCRALAKAMAGAGVAVEYAASGRDAVEMARAAQGQGKPYSLALLDWEDPGVDGPETARRLRALGPGAAPVLLLTACDWGEIEQEAAEIGIQHFLPKPFFMSRFEEAARRLLGSAGKAADTDADVVRGRHILVVDDIPVNQIILAKILTALGAECDTAGNGKEALEAFAASPPEGYDLILMDVQMPVMDGYAAARAIRGSGHPAAQSVPIIAVTANAFKEDIQDALASGMDAHIAKPVQPGVLKSTIRQVLEGR